MSDEFLDGLFKQLRPKMVKGNKIADLNSDDIAERAIMDAKIEAFSQKVQEIDVENKAIDIENSRWWIKARKKYNISGQDYPALHLEDGAIWEWKPTESK